MRGRTHSFWLYVILVLVAAFYLAPIYVLVNASFKSFAEMGLDRMWNPPQSLDWAGYAKAWFGDASQGLPGLSSSFVNSLQLAVAGTLIAALVGSVNGYLLARWKFRGADVVFSLLLFGMFIPYQSVLIPLGQMLQMLHLFDTLPGLVLVHVVYGLPVTALIFRNYYAGISTELIEAATIDGASLLGVYRWVMVPLSAPGWATVVVWQFISIWNEFLFAATLTTPSTQPVTVALNNLAGSYIVEWNVQMAGALLTALPPLLMYLLMGRFLMGGLASAVKD